MTTKAKVATTRLDDAEPRPARRQEPKARATVTLSRVKGLRTFQADLPHEVVWVVLLEFPVEGAIYCGYLLGVERPWLGFWRHLGVGFSGFSSRFCLSLGHVFSLWYSPS